LITPTSLADAFKRNIWILQRQTEDMSHEESLIQLPFRGNCMNWLLGHILTNRNNVFKLLGHEGLAHEEVASRYQRDSEPIESEGPGVVPLSELRSSLEQAQDELEGILAVIKPEELERQVAFFGNRSMSIAEWLLFFYFHDTYHTGQTEILRQASGRDDKVI
jgi:uncharacterized damage-inducible protein DinB